jgi:hypothetical protein
MSNAFAPQCELDLAPSLADLFIVGVAPLITARYLSSNPSDSGSLRTPCPPRNHEKNGFRFVLAVSGFRLRARLDFSIPSSPRPARHYPRLWIQRPSSGRRRDFNPPDSRAAQRTLCLVCLPCLHPADICGKTLRHRCDCGSSNRYVRGADHRAPYRHQTNASGVGCGSEEKSRFLRSLLSSLMPVWHHVRRRASANALKKTVRSRGP